MTLIWLELRRELIILRAYGLNMFIDIVMYPFIFTLMIFVFSDVSAGNGTVYDTSDQFALVIGVLLWTLCGRVMADMSLKIKEESDAGTLEPIILSSTNPLKLFMARTVVSMIIHFTKMTLMATLFFLFLGIHYPLSSTALIVLLLTLIGMGGLGLLFAGITLVYKQTEGFVSFGNTLALFAAGALVPINSLGILFDILRWVFPMTWGTDILRHLFIANFTEDFILREQIMGLAIQTLLLVGIGMLVFQWGLRRAKREATLATY